eukprot:TRINITY_DN34066_c0_g1_i1.p1 TRINITY_DN34066_c0_g1~~TRINITY_DN34066_c0_g1_i1.p1  ORF type:complete len:397 (+),score=95.61 TRINITY_DN34066_c0_g1_i1:29-1192(+)
MQLSDSTSSGTRVPLTILTGFLGAGKTARLNATLSTSKSRVAVIENEIGAVGVDGALVANVHPEEDGIIELANGCLCCSAEVDLVAALEALAQRHRAKALDRVIIETTGLADVGPVIALLEDPDDPLAEDFILDGVVTVVDAASFQKWTGGHQDADAPGPITSWSSGFGGTSLAQKAQGPTVGPGRSAALKTFWRQVAFADQIILSKLDLAGDANEKQTCEALQAANPLAEIIKASSEAASAQSLPPPRGCQRCGSMASLRQRSRSGFCEASAKKLRAEHLEGIESQALRAEGSYLEAPLSCLVKGLLDGEVWRVKGIISVEGRGPVLLQGAGDQVTLEPWSQPFEEQFLVFIGEELKREKLEAALASCQSDEAANRKALSAGYDTK